MTTRTDAQLHKNVVDELMFEPGVDESKVAVAVSRGVVTLSGSVPTYTGKWAAEKAVKRVHGVLGVAEELTVRALPDLLHTDTDIARAARRALDGHVVASQENVQVRVEKGVVTLEGEVESQFQRQNAHDAVAHLLGVRGVSNRVALRPQATPNTLHAGIEAALRRNSALNADHVSVEVKGSCVVLRGHLPSWAEIDAAVLAAWNAAGVTSVNSQLTIGS